MSNLAFLHGVASRPVARLLPPVALAALSVAALAGDGPLWTHESGPENWVGRVVSIGNDGNQVFATLGILDGHARLFSATDTNPPTPIWEDEHPDFAYDHAVDSASRADVHAYLHYEAPDIDSSNLPVLHRYGDTGPEPSWDWPFPFEVSHPNGGVCVSEDGEVVVGWVFDAISGSTAIAAFLGESADPVAYTTLYTFGEPKAVHMTADGSLLYIASGIKTILIDPISGELVHEHINWDGVGNGHALSADGSTFAQAIPLNRVRVYRWQGASYEELFEFQHQGPTLCNNLDLSGDGALLAAAFDHYDSWLEVSIVALDLSDPDFPVVLEDTSIGEGSYSNLASDISIADDGSAFVVGLWGDELGAAPELRVYSFTNGRWGLTETHDLPGSVNDVDMAPDGQRFAVASKGIHANDLGGDGQIDCFTVAQPDFELVGMPRLGATVTFLHRVPPGTAGRALFSPRLADQPIPYPGIGLLYLDRAQLGSLGTGTADERGLIETDYTVPSDPDLVGSSIYFQGAGLAPRAFTESWIRLTILP